MKTLNEKDSDPGSDSGLSLAGRLRQGADDGAWSELVRLYGPLVDRWCRTGGVPHAAIADVAQEVFLAAFRGLDRFDANRDGATFRGWLWTVARSRIVEHHRRNAGHAVAQGGSTALALLQQVVEPVPTQDPTEPDHWASLIHRAMNQIKVDFAEATWDLFWRSAVLGHPTDLIAAEYKITPGAVRQAKSRVLRRLRKQLS